MAVFLVVAFIFWTSYQMVACFYIGVIELLFKHPFQFNNAYMKKYYGAKITKQKGARNFAKEFYAGKTWRIKSKTYRKLHPLCERCLKRGIYKRAECVHHKIHIDENNYMDQQILLNDNNLESLCGDCHAKEHAHGTTIYYEYDENGKLIDFTK